MAKRIIAETYEK